MAISEDIDAFMGERGLSLDDIRVLHPTETVVYGNDAYGNETVQYVHALILAYSVTPSSRIHNVPVTRETQRLDSRDYV